MTEKRTGVRHEIETALEEVLAHVRGEVALPGRIVDDPTADRIIALSSWSECAPASSSQT